MSILISLGSYWIKRSMGWREKYSILSLRLIRIRRRLMCTLICLLWIWIKNLIINLMGPLLREEAMDLIMNRLRFGIRYFIMEILWLGKLKELCSLMGIEMNYIIKGLVCLRIYLLSRDLCSLDLNLRGDLRLECNSRRENLILLHILLLVPDSSIIINTNNLSRNIIIIMAINNNNNNNIIIILNNNIMGRILIKDLDIDIDMILIIC